MSFITELAGDQCDHSNSLSAETELAIELTSRMRSIVYTHKTGMSFKITPRVSSLVAVEQNS